MTCHCRQNRMPVTHRIARVVRETDMVTSFTFDVSLGAKPGQFVMLWLPGVDEIPMSIALDDGQRLQVTFFAVGDMTQKLAQLKKGDLVGLRGPFGTHYDWKPEERLALVAGGYGAAPMYFVATEAVKTGCTVDVFVGARAKEHLLYVETLSALSRTTVHVATDDGSEGFKGTNVALLRQVLTEKKSAVDQIFACGPERMLVAVQEMAEETGIPCQLSLERYMKCGFGLCGNCAVDPSGIRLCVDGPVIKGELCKKIAEFGKYHRDALGKKHVF
ncbi:MAG: dihydroorotate dehydrogenase electron transfer subunit [Candidatus Peribacteraceae bacterium]|nr:dihydroorotate dehydrogenase electron transfer subunit [Candidatus Peribacteraceae bacterium]